MSETKEIRVMPDEQLQEKIDALKEYLKIKGNTELIRQLITEKYQEIPKPTIDPSKKDSELEVKEV